MLHTIKALPLGSKLAGIIAVLVIAFSGTALAGELPDSLQDSVSDTATLMGVTLPSSDSGDSQDPETDLQSDLEGVDSDTEESAKPTDNHGAEVSAVATDKTAIDGNHGGAVSEVASKNSYSEQNQGAEKELAASNGSDSEEGNSEEGNGAEATNGDSAGADSNGNHGSEMAASAPGKSK